MRPSVPALALAILLPGLGALPIPADRDQQAAVPVREEPMHHLVLENPDVRVYDVVVPGGRSTLFHTHALDYAYVVLGDATLKSETQGQAATDLPMTSGDVRFTAGPITHRVINVGTTPFHNITIELVAAPSGPAAALPVLPARMPETVVLENDRVRATRVVLAPSQATPARSLPPRTLVIPVTAGSVLYDTAGRGPRTVDLEAGKVEWYAAAVTQAATNTGRSRVEIVYLELK